MSVANIIVRQLYAAKQFARTIWNGRSVNPFIYEECARLRVKAPDTPVPAVPYYAQLAEDRIVMSLLDALAETQSQDLADMVYIEIGANHPIATSSTYLLSRERNMSGILVEANERLLPALRASRPGDRVVYAAVQADDVSTVQFSVSNLSELSSVDRRFVQEWDRGRIGESALVTVPALRINQILEMAETREIAYLSVDVEGLDLVLLKDVDFKRFRPWIVQAEPSDHHLPGNTDAIIEHMRSVGYRLVARTDFNLIFSSS